MDNLGWKWMKWMGKRKARESPKQRIHIQFDRNVFGTSIFGQWRSGNQCEVEALSCSCFAAESAVSIKIQVVNVLRQAQAGIHKTEVISHTTEHHIGLHYREAAQMESIINKVLLGFLEGKRQQFHFMRNAVMQSAVAHFSPIICHRKETKIHYFLAKTLKNEWFWLKLFVLKMGN